MKNDIILYLVGTDAENAETRWPFDSEESAYSYAADNPGLEVFTVVATLDLSTIEPA